MSSEFNIFTLFFPAIMLTASSIFFYHGVRRLSASQLKGIIKSKIPVKDYHGNSCVYTRLEVDYYVDGHQQWKQLYCEEQRAAFSFEGKTINSDSADIRINPKKITIGYFNRDKGIFENFFDGLTFQISKDVTKSISQSPLGAVVDSSPKIFINDNTTKMLLKIPKLKKLLSPHIKKQFRITEYILANGSKITLGVCDSDIYKPFLITDQNDAKHVIREKSFLTLSLGFLFALLSFAVLITIILSL
ncbi:MAG: hypothetical protein ABID61_01555 [Candidatus Micrarchaeota archaeon]